MKSASPWSRASNFLYASIVRNAAPRYILLTPPPEAKKMRSVFAVVLAVIIVVCGLTAMGILLYNVVVLINNWWNPL
mgnify:CR=1 FL=1